MEGDDKAMSNTIDQKVVEMRFDNRQFEQNVQSSLSTLDKLKQSLKLTDSAKGLENINSSVKNINLSPLQNAAEAVSLKFSAMEVMAVTALANITNSAVNAGKQMLNALTIEPIREGFSEYELKMGSVQTIMASTGESLETVNGYLNELNTYADKTIYSFSDMTSSIGKFTNSGVKLGDAVKAIQGISNEAAISGANAEQASHAMYNFAQALSSGAVKLIDWKSIENANMATVEFKNTLIESGLAMGTLTKVGDKYISTTTDLNGKTSEAFTATSMFNDSLSHQWMTSEVLVDALGKYADETTDLGKRAFAAAQDVKTFSQLMDTLKEAVGSGWATTWEIIFGDFNEAKALWTGVSNVVGGMIDTMSDARNSFLEGGLSTGWKQLIDSGIADAEEFKDVVRKVAESHGTDVSKMIDETGSFEESLKKGWATSDVLTESIDKMAAGIRGLSKEQLLEKGYTQEQAEALIQLDDSIKNGSVSMDIFAKKLTQISGREHLINSVRNAFNALLSIVKPIKEAFSEIFPPATSEMLYSLTERLDNFTQKLILSDDTMGKLHDTFRGLFAVIDIVRQAFSAVISVLARVISNIIPIGSGFADVILSAAAAFGSFLAGVDETIKSSQVFNRVVDAMFKGLKPIAGVIQNAVSAISGFIVKAIDWVNENEILIKVFNGVVNSIAYFIDKVKGWIDAFVQLPIVQRNISRFRDAFSDTLSDLNLYISGGAEKISEFIEYVKSLDKISLDNIGDIFKHFKDIVLDYFFNLDGKFTSLRGALSAFADDVTEYFGQIGGRFSWLKDKILDFFNTVKTKISDHIGLGEVLTVGMGVGIILFVKKVGDALSIISNPLESFGKFMDSLSDVIESFSGVLKAYSKKIKADSLFQISKAIAVLVASIALLTQLDQSKMWAAVGVLGALSAGLVAVSFAIGKIGNPGDIVITASYVIAMGIAIKLFASALKSIDELNTEHILKDLGILAGLAAGLVGVAATLGRCGSGIRSGAVVLVGFAAAMKILVSALKDISEIDVNRVNSSLEILLGAMAGLAVVSLACKGLSFGSAASVLAIVAALKILIGTIDDIANIDTNNIKNNLGSFIAIFGMFSVLMAASHLAGANAAKAGVAILAMSASLLIIIGVIKLISGMDSSGLSKGLTAVSLLMTVFAAVIAASNFAGEHAAQAGVMLLLMSVSIGILAGVMVLLSHLEPEGMYRAIAAITALELVFGAIIAVTALAKDCKSTITMIAVTIGVLAVALGGLSMINPENLAAATAALSAVMAMFALVVASTGLAQNAAKTLAVITAAIGVIGVVLYSLGGLPVESSLAAAASLSLVLISLSAAIAIISNVQSVSASALITLGVMVAITGLLGGMLALLASLNIGPTLEIAASLSILITSLSAACLLLSAAGTFGAAAFVGIGVLITLIASVGGLMIAIGALAEHFPGLEAFLNKGLVLLQQIGYGIGSFVGNVVGGLIEGALSKILTLGDDLSSFMSSLTPFLEGAKNIDSASMSGIKSLAEAILVLTAANLVDGISRWLTGGSSLSDFAKQLVPFGEGLVSYGETVAGLNTSAIVQSKTAATALIEIANLVPNSGGLLGFFAGNNDLDDFGNTLEAFGKGLSNYGTTVDGLKSEAIINSKPAATALIEIANLVPNSGGLLGFFAGNNDLDDFGNTLEAFGKGLSNYGTTVDGLKSEAIINSKPAATALIEIANLVPNSGGLLGFFAGNNDLDDFGNTLEAFGKGLSNYGTAVNGLNSEAIINSKPAAEALIEISKLTPNSGGLLGFYAGNNDLNTFGNTLKAFGEGLNDYGNAVENLKTDKINASVYAARGIVNLSNVIADIKISDLKSFGKRLKDFGKDFADYVDSIEGIDANALSQVSEEIRKLADVCSEITNINTDSITSFSEALENLGAKGIEGFIKSFDGADTKVSEAVNKLIKSFADSVNSKKASFGDTFKELVKSGLDGVNNKGVEFKAAGTNLIDSFSEGISTGKAKVNSTISEFVSSMTAAINSKYSDFISSGSYVIQGFINGMNSKRSEVYRKASEIAQSALDAVDDTHVIASPGKEDIKKGEFIGEGLAVGIENKEDRVYEAAEKTSGAALEAVAENSEEAVKMQEETEEERTKRYQEYWNRVFEITAEGFGKEKETAEEENRLKENRLKTEGDYWKRLLEIRKKGTDAASFKDMSFEDFKTDVLEKTTEALKNYADELENTADSLMDISSLFTEVQKQEEVSADSLFKNLQEHTADMIEFANMKKAVSKRIKNAHFKEAFEELGEDARAEITAFYKMSDEDLEKYEKMFEAHFIACQMIAVDTTEETAKKLEKELSDLYGGVDIDIQDFLNSFDGSMESIDKFVKRSIKSSKTAAEGAAKGVEAAEIAVETAAENTKQAHEKALNEEQDYWEKLLEIQKQGAEAEKYEAMSLEDFQEEMVSKTKERLEDYRNELDSTTDSLMNAGNIFSEVQEQEKVSADTLTQNLQDQVKQMGEFTNVVTSLNQRITNPQLKEAINQMGVDNLAELQAMNSMTDKQLEEYVKLFEERYRLSREAAVQQTSGMREDIEKELSDMFGGVPINIEGLENAFDGTFVSLDSYIRQAAANSGMNLTKGIALGITTGTQEAKEAAGQMIKDVEQSAKDAALINSPSKLFADEVGSYIGQGIAAGISDDGAKAAVSGSVGTLMGYILETARASFDGFSAYISEILKNTLTEFTEGADGEEDSLLPIFDGMLKNVFDGVKKKYGEFVTTGQNLIINILSGIDSTKSKITEDFTKLIFDSLNLFRNKYNDFKMAGKDTAARLDEGIRSQETRIVNSFSSIMSRSLSSVRGEEYSFYQAGLYLAEGLENGIESGSYAVADKAREMARAAAEAVERELEINSPSKVFYRIGGFAGLGFVNALEKYRDISYNTGLDVAEGAKKGFSQAVAKISDIAEGKLSVNPTITPVVDMSEVYGSARSLRDLFDSRSTFSFGMDISGYIGDMEKPVDILSDKLDGLKNDAVVNAVSELRSEVAELAESMKYMRVVLDSGTLVGEIAPEMDKNLGMISKYRRRGF